MDNLLYSVKGANVIKKENKEHKTTYEYMIKCVRDGNIITMSFEEINYSGSELINYINPLFVIKELVFKVDNSNRIMEILNFDEVKQRLDDYFTFMIDIKKDSLSFLFEVFREELFKNKEKAIKDMLEIDFFYIFNGGLVGNDEVELHGIIPNKTIPAIIEKTLNQDLVVFNYKINDEKLDLLFNFERYNKNLIYEKDSIFLSSDCKIKVDVFGIENVNFSLITGYMDLMERRVKVEIKRVGINNEF